VKDTYSVNFYGGPGTGKSRIAASVFAKLKFDNLNCELVREYAKEKTWEKNHMALNYQMYISSKQMYKMWVVANSVDVIVTDSPLLLGACYSSDDLLDKLLLREYRNYHNINIFLNRVNPYNPSGRNQTEEEAELLDLRIEMFLHDYKIPFDRINASLDQTDNIIKLIKSKIKK